MMDCGEDWRGRLSALAPTAIVLTHAHPDHAYGLADGASCPVYATEETLDLLRRFPIPNRHRIQLGKSTIVDGVTFKAFPVRHSIRAPAVGYRVSVENCSFIYLPDLADLPMPAAALRGVALYIGDGASVTRTMARRRKAVLIGHAPIVTQLRWCEIAGVRRAIFTHCGSGIVRSDARQVEAKVRRLGRDHGIEARLARDGDHLSLPAVDKSTSRA